MFFAVFLWFLAVAGLAYLSSGFTDFRAQVYFSAGILAAFFLFKRIDPSRRFARLTFLCIACFLVLRYLIWRILYTIEFTDWLSFSCAVILFVAEFYGIVIFANGVFVNVSPITRKPVPLPPEDELPTVDVYVPSYNEDKEILRVTLIAALQMRYPKDKRKVFLCDDGGTDQKCETGNAKQQEAARTRRAELQELCEIVGAHYLTRARNLKAKAGNLNEAFKQTNGDLVVILDADHVPTEDFLENTVGLFSQDEKLFLVQTPHFFGNPDPIEKNLETFNHMPGENEMFYKVIQKGLDFWNSAFFCGSAAVMRRKHLEKTGGIAGETITEDAETALMLHSMGYNSAYISRPMVSGLSPETIGAFIVQRIRWAQGMVQILLLKSPLFLKGLTLPQRICYFNSCAFWFFPFSRLIFLIAPMAFLFFGLKIYAANWQTFCAYVIPYLLAVFGVSNYLFGKVRLAFVSELYELIQSVYTLPAIVSTILNPRKPSFAVTPKGETLGKDFISPMVGPFYVLAAINLATVGMGIYRLFQANGGADVYPIAITLFWGVLNTVILLAALGALHELRQRRATPRMASNIPAELLVDERALPCKLSNLSLGGCRMVLSGVRESSFTNLGQAKLRVSLGPAGNDPEELHIQFRNRGTDETTGDVIIGAAFLHDSLAEMKAKVRLVCGDSSRWVQFQERRESNRGVLGGFASLASLGVTGSLRHFRHLFSSNGSVMTEGEKVLETQKSGI
jgi:cellulose synthase (UDP-forming)